MSPDKREKLLLLQRRLVIGLAFFTAISAMGGGIALLVFRTGKQFVPLKAIEYTPFTSFLVPGLLLAIVVGGTNLACAMLTWRRSNAAIDATILAGGALTVWIVAEVAMMRGVHWLHAVYGAIGVAILGLGVRAGWRSHVPRHRWVISVTLAETIGFFVPACAGIVSVKAGLSDARQVGMLVAAGLVEGFALGFGQAWAFPFPVRRLHYALFTALGAGIVWLSVMVMMHVARDNALPFPVVLVAGIATGLIGLAAIGSAQWMELRHHTSGAVRWIAWTALAWTIALPLSFTPAPFVDESTPSASQVVLWGCAGLLMAHVMALITWQGVRRLRRARKVAAQKMAGTFVGAPFSGGW